MKPVYRVYILRNPPGRHYIGLTENVGVRLQQHNVGESKWTARHRPWTLIWQSDELDLGAARKLENLLKRQKGGSGFYQLTGMRKPSS
jgi:predicted GIY-YIG superfamily endonuclease